MIRWKHHGISLKIQQGYAKHEESAWT
jgi:hypothetical protein